MSARILRRLSAALALAATPAYAQDAPLPVAQPEPPPPFIYLLPPPPPPPPLPPEVRRMIEIAIADGDEGAAKQIIAVARKVAPAGHDDIEGIEKAWKADLAAKAAAAEEKRLARLRAAGPFEVWSGNIEVGGTRATGTSSSLGAFASVNLERATIDWTHKLTASADLQQTNGQTSAERILAAWQPSYRMDQQTYAFGLAQYERDPFAGYDTRATIGGGLGYRAVRGPNLRLELEGGPALRHTATIDGGDRTHIVGRGSLNLQWQVTPSLKLSQQTALFLESDASSAVATTALDTKLIGNLKARLSYNVQYEGNTPIGTDALNTQSRVTFLYGF